VSVGGGRKDFGHFWPNCAFKSSFGISSKSQFDILTAKVSITDGSITSAALGRADCCAVSDIWPSIGSEPFKTVKNVENSGPLSKISYFVHFSAAIWTRA
jgi:hypothetical protein